MATSNLKINKRPSPIAAAMATFYEKPRLSMQSMSKLSKDGGVSTLTTGADDSGHLSRFSGSEEPTVVGAAAMFFLLRWKHGFY